ncbi:MAG TPA: NAD-dependent epimerase/dehydratase family protein, partial [Planctomycetota bacterium]|nr:NAD-dependent epimerase/dehydratase family protein [Planctomycetota bacterium]
MRVLLTGATGFIGSHVARELLRRGHEVHATVRPGSDRRRIADLAALRLHEGGID